jgi:hypothetical protein
VDIISDDTFEYQNVTAARVGGFDWSLLFNWNYNLEVGGRKVEAGQPVPTPTMPGGLFSVNREFFLSLGGYDPGKGCRKWRSIDLCHARQTCIQPLRIHQSCGLFSYKESSVSLGGYDQGELGCMRWKVPT